MGSDSNSHLWVDLVCQGLEVDGCGRDLFAIGCVVAMGQVTSAGQVKSHDAIMRVQQRCVDCKVRRAACAKTSESEENERFKWTAQ